MFYLASNRPFYCCAKILLEAGGEGKPTSRDVFYPALSRPRMKSVAVVKMKSMMTNEKRSYTRYMQARRRDMYSDSLTGHDVVVFRDNSRV